MAELHGLLMLPCRHLSVPAEMLRTFQGRYMLTNNCSGSGNKAALSRGVYCPGGGNDGI